MHHRSVKKASLLRVILCKDHTGMSHPQSSLPVYECDKCLRRFSGGLMLNYSQDRKKSLTGVYDFSADITE